MQELLDFSCRDVIYSRKKKGSLIMKSLFVIALMLAMLIPARAGQCSTLIDRVVAIVGQDTIKLSELQSEMAPALQDLNQRLRGEELARATDQLKRSTLNNLVDKHLQLQEAKLQGIEVTEDEVTRAVEDIMQKNKMDKATFAAELANEGYSMEDYRKTLSDQLKMIRLLSRAVKSKITISEPEIKDYYDKNLEKYTAPESVKVANILFPAKAGGMDEALKNAQKARAEVLAGTPFEDMAAKCTGDPGASKTCVLGTFSRGELSKDVEEKAFSMKEGEVSEPLQTDKGYQLIKIMSKKGSGVKSLQDAHDEIVDELSSEKTQEVFAKWVQDLRKRSYVEIRELP
jgi:peptidyl-prolyl cis-trans isomerase SurA